MRTRTMLRRIKNIPPIVSNEFPYAGPCAFCGATDRRHRMFDSIAGAVRAGDGAARVAKDFDVPLPVIRAIVKWWRE